MRDADGQVTRLAWEARGDAPRDPSKQRTLPAGKYTLIGYRIVDRSRNGEVWHISGSGMKLRKLEVPASGEMRIEVAPKLTVKQRFDGASAGFEIRGSDGAGVTVYKNGKRIPMGYRLLGDKGDELDRGTMNYG